MLKHLVKILTCYTLLMGMLLGLAQTAYAAPAYVVKEYDLTTGSGGNEGSLPCVWTSTYDNDYHWDVCANHKTAGTFNGVAHTANGVRGNKVAHSKNTPAMVGCSGAIAVPIQRCTAGCGWSRHAAEYKREHTIPSTWTATDLNRGHHVKRCSVCDNWLISGDCITAAGVNLRLCNSPAGVCKDCGNTINNPGHKGTFVAIAGDSRIWCDVCNATVGSAVVTSNGNTNGNTITNYDLTLTSHTFQSLSGPGTCHDVTGAGFTAASNSYATDLGGRRAYGSYTTKVNSSYVLPYDSHQWFNINGNITGMHVATPGRYDWTVPSYKTHSTNPVVTAGSWSTQRDITVTFSDTGAVNDYLEIGLFNSSGAQLVSYGSATHLGGGDFQRTFRLMIDAPAGGANFILRARDRHNQVGEKTISLSYTDAVAPVVASLTGHSTTWTKSKTLRLTATELGSGSVEMALNDVSDYCLAVQNGTSYYRDFIVKGTVASPVEQSFLIRDAIGNLTVYKYKVGYLDSTAPTLTLSQSPDTTGSTWHKGSITITAVMQDTTSGLTNVIVPAGCSGAGTVSLGNVTNQITRTFTVTSPGTYNFTVTDQAGNTTTKSITVVKVDNINPEQSAVA